MADCICRLFCSGKHGFFLSQVIFLLAQGKPVVDLFAYSSYSFSPGHALWNWFVPCAKTHHTMLSGVCKPTGGTVGVSHFNLQLAMGVQGGEYGPQLSFSHWLDPVPPWFPQQTSSDNLKFSNPTIFSGAGTVKTNRCTLLTAQPSGKKDVGMDGEGTYCVHPALCS